MRSFLSILLLSALFSACKSTEKPDNNIDEFLISYNQKYQELSTKSSEAEWKLNTMIIEGDSVSKMAADKAKEAYAEFTGSKENIEKATELLSEENLNPVQKKQLERILYLAANNPAKIKDKVKERINAETNQIEKLFGYDFKLNGRSVSTNDIDSILNSSTDLPARRAAWESSKEVGKELKSGLVKLRSLRNETVQALGYEDFFTYQVSDYGMNNEEMMDLMDRMVTEIWPLYRELHTYARYELAKKYNQTDVPKFIPAFWLPNRWGQDWSGMVEVQGLNLDSVLKTKDAKWMVEQAERFYVSLGLPELPRSFYEKSSLYPLPANAGYKKNNHASAWHINLENDVRSLMSIKQNAEWYETVHHEFGHIYYYLAYTNPDVPPLLREGANRAYHEAIGSMLGLAAMQKPFLAGLNLLPPDSKTDEMQTLLKEALNYVVFIPFSAGVMTGFENELYTKNLPEDHFNQKWWQLATNYQGIASTFNRSEDYCDAASKTHINDDAAQYYDYAISYILLFQLHDHIAKKILKQDPHATNYYGSKEVGAFLTGIMKPGASRDWREVLKEKTGSDLSAKAMLSYFEPLMAHLKKVNQGRTHTLPETFSSDWYSER